jgi:hypothetical protein
VDCSIFFDIENIVHLLAERRLAASLAFWLEAGTSTAARALRDRLLSGRPVPLHVVPQLPKRRRRGFEDYHAAARPEIEIPVRDPACAFDELAVRSAFKAAGRGAPWAFRLRPHVVHVVRFAQPFRSRREFWLLTDSGLARSGVYLANQFHFGALALRTEYCCTDAGICHLYGYPILEFTMDESENVNIITSFATAFHKAPVWLQRAGG